MSVENVLLKLASQLSAFDEASLMALWEKYAQEVHAFEPSKRWEQAVLVFGMIQAMRFKNQLFNYHWSEGQAPSKLDAPPGALDIPKPAPAGVKAKPAKKTGPGKVIEFKPKNGEGE